MTTDRRLRLLVVPGTTPGRWLRTWGDRLPDVPAELVQASVAEQLDLLRAGAADVGLVRLAERPEDLSAIPLYTEATVVVVPRGHVVTAADEVTAADLVDETMLTPADDVLGWADPPGEPALLVPATTEEAVELVASGVGVLVVPQSLARLHDHKDVTYRPVVDAPTSSVALAWVADRTTPDVETFVGIVRGRTANSSRGATADDDASPTAAATGAGAGRRGEKEQRARRTPPGRVGSRQQRPPRQGPGGGRRRSGGRGR